MRILGIDPGLVNTGWGLVEKKGSSLKLIAFGLIKPDPKASMTDRLSTLFEKLSHVISSHDINGVALEETFVNQNPKSTLKLGMARGIALMCPGHHNLPCTEYTPNQIKKSIVGAGHANKEQIITMVKVILSTQEDLNEHSADALAVAITHLHHLESEKIRTGL